jgi:hypothetical protein
VGNVNSEREKMDSVSLSVAGEKISCVPRRKKGILQNPFFLSLNLHFPPKKRALSAKIFHHN